MNINKLGEDVKVDTNGRYELSLRNPRQDNALKASAEYIVHRLRKQSRALFYRGYGSAQLVFSDCSFVGGTDWPLLSEVERLLTAGEKPLGIIAPLTDEKGKPHIESWQSAEEDATAALKDAAQLLYGHRM